MADSAPGGSRASGITIGVPREIVADERRVSLIPEAVGRLVKRGNPVLVQSGAGDAAYLLDDQYTTAGAEIVPDAATLYQRAGLILKIHRPQESGENGNELDLLRPGQALVAFLQPLFNPDLVQALADRKVTAFSMDAIPRTTRAQYMDSLSAMSTVAGYKAVLIAAERLPEIFPASDDCGGHDRTGKGARHRRRCSRSAGDRHSPPPGRRRRGIRRPPGRQGAGGKSRGKIRRDRYRRVGHPDQRRLRQGDDRRSDPAAARGPRCPGRRQRHRHHHRPGTWSPGAEADHRRRGPAHAARLNRGRPGR